MCDGYTGAHNLLLKLEGIECTSLFNDSHIWTLATLDGTQYHIDVTSGDQYGRTDLRYFGMSEEQSCQCSPPVRWRTKKEIRTTPREPLETASLGLLLSPFELCAHVRQRQVKALPQGVAMFRRKVLL